MPKLIVVVGVTGTQVGLLIPTSSRVDFIHIRHRASQSQRNSLPKAGASAAPRAIPTATAPKFSRRKASKSSEQNWTILTPSSPPFGEPTSSSRSQTSGRRSAVPQKLSTELCFPMQTNIYRMLSRITMRCNGGRTLPMLRPTRRYCRRWKDLSSRH